MKRLILTSLVALGVVSNANAGAYVSGHLSTITDSEYVANGNTIKNDISFSDHLNLDMAVGYAFSNGFRLEADIATVALRQKGKDFFDAVGLEIGVHMVKGLYDVKVDMPLTPYFGVGMADFKIDNDGFNFDVVGVIGVSFPINNQFAIDLQYNRTFWYEKEDGIKASHSGVNVFKLGGVLKF
ncbi:MAG: porin family protein [Alphaproteobacteria bacterium]|nr:porin family protein [Alphaproteobacteria bacterium]